MAILEDVEDVDIDNMDFDPTDFDPRRPNDPFAKKSRQPTVAQSEPATSSGQGLPGFPTSDISQISQSTRPGPEMLKNSDDMKKFKSWICLYPVYFDAKKSHNEGRRVSKDLAVENPLAQTIAESLRPFSLQTVLETDRTHPKDWANPGRVKVDLRSSTQIKNKRHLFRVVGEYLKSHEPTLQTPLKSPVWHQMLSAGAVKPDGFKPEPLAVPKGYAINKILPVQSRAISAGELPEEMKKMQQQMLGGLGGMAPNMPEVPKRQKIQRVRGH